MNTSHNKIVSENRRVPNPELLSRYERIPVTTHKIMIGEEITEIFARYVQPVAKAGDVACVSQKVVAICEKSVVHISQVKAGFLAKLITTFVTKWPDDVGYERPEKMQVAINQAGGLRIVLAIVIGGVLKLLGKRGYFYRIAGGRISEIDGFNDKAIPPFNEYAMIPSPNETEVCERLFKRFQLPVFIIDGNNISTKVMAMSGGFTSLTKDDLADLVYDNPMGQGDRMTPIMILRKK